MASSTSFLAFSRSLSSCSAKIRFRCQDSKGKRENQLTKLKLCRLDRFLPRFDLQCLLSKLLLLTSDVCLLVGVTIESFSPLCDRHPR